jgi:hypothetical protein
VAANLEAEPLADLMRLTAIADEGLVDGVDIGGRLGRCRGRRSALGRSRGGVLLLRALELEHHPPSRGNA